MLPTELWIVIATDMPTRDLYNLSLCSKDIYHSIKGILNIRRLIIKFVNKCAFSNLHYRSYNDPELYIPTDVCISEYQMVGESVNEPYPIPLDEYKIPYPSFVNRYVKQHWDIYFIPWQLGSRGERKLYLESHPDCSSAEFYQLHNIEMNIFKMKLRRPIDKSYPYPHKAEPGITSKNGYIKQYRHPDHTVCYKCRSVCGLLEVDEVFSRHDLNKNGGYTPRYKVTSICNECFDEEYKAEYDSYKDSDIDLFD